MKNDHKSCVPENMVAYIYSEMDETEAPAFERHLAECSACADEFAAVSDARLSIFEWKRDAFDTLAVPHFEIPHEKVAAARVGWFDAIVANIRVLAGAAAACTVLAVAAGLGFYFLQPADSNLSAAIAPVAVPEKKVEVAQETTPLPVESKPATVPGKKAPAVTKRQFAPVPVIARTPKAPINNSMVARVTPTPKQTNQKSVNQDSLPTLNNFEDISDDSLRLADLLAEMDAKNDK